MEINVRPSINLKSEIQIVDGTGIQSDPYILEGDIQEPENGTTLLNTRYSGEYVTFNNELYRIIGVESIDGVQLIKIRAVDSPENFKWVEFAISDHNINDNNFANYDVKADLENYYQELATTNVNDYNMIQPNTTWYLGTVAEGGSYKTSICEIAETNISTSTCEKTKATTTANIGLVRLGEMFASVIDRTAAGSYDSWTLTGVTLLDVNSSNKVWYFSYHLYSLEPPNQFNAHPTMYLKSNAVIASDNTGNGTYEKPYSIELGA